MRGVAAAGLALALAACATTGEKDNKPNPVAEFDRNPYPSTYRAYNVAPTSTVSGTARRLRRPLRRPEAHEADPQ